MTAEQLRIEQSRARTNHWKRWGPYLAERAWGTVREDYSANAKPWAYFPFDHARSRTYRWNEDGIAGISDRRQKICFSLAFWNGRDPFLKERLFGLDGDQGNHAEDCKECYYYLDSTPTHSYMKFLYKYPHKAFPYADLIAENGRRNRDQPEYELLDTGVFDENRYWDVFVEYAKAGPDDILVRITAHNRGPETAELHLLPTLWFRNTWSWGHPVERPSLRAAKKTPQPTIELDEPYYGQRRLACEGDPDLLFTENESNQLRLWNLENSQEYVKDSINDYVVNDAKEAINPRQFGTKASAHYRVAVASRDSVTIRLRLSKVPPPPDPFFKDASGMVEPSDSTPFDASFEATFDLRIKEADSFYATVIPADASDDERNVMRQSFAGMLWSKQFYHYVVRDWLRGDPDHDPPPARRLTGRNSEWTHLYNADIISMPDKWEYPWYAAWDTAFHAIPLALVDSDFAKDQLQLMVREWYMHPNGQLPAYEWALGDVNPPVHAWATLRVYQIEKKRHGAGDRFFLERIFHKLLLNFTWWVNRKDTDHRNVFQGGFLGLDNIGVFDRSKPLPTGKHLEQADGTGWMAMYSLNMLAIALELSIDDTAYEDVASKFWEHFLFISHAINHLGSARADDPTANGDAGDIGHPLPGKHTGMWDEEDGFYYDQLHFEDGVHMPLKIRSMVGLIPLFAVETLEPSVINKLSGFKRRMKWFIQHRPDLTCNVAEIEVEGEGHRRLLSILDPPKLRRVLRVMLDENEFLSPHGIRSLSRAHLARPYHLPVHNELYTVDYEPGESRTWLFGGNSNWRGPVWFPVNYLIIESLQRYDYYLGKDFKVECPTGSGKYMTLWEVSQELERRLNSLFLKDSGGHRPAHGTDERYAEDPHWRDLVLFYEYFHGDNGKGLGANHQTGWTGLVAKLLQQEGTSSQAGQHTKDTAIGGSPWR